MNSFLKILGLFILSFILIFVIGGGTDIFADTILKYLNDWFGLGISDYGTLFVLILVLLIVVLVLVFISLLVGIRFRKTIVFISFKHVHEAKAIDLEKRLIAAGLGVERLAFSPNYTHDEVVQQVRLKLQKSHVVVTIPDAENASFVDSELLAASVLKIPIVLIQYQKEQAQPGTLLMGYPIFNYKCIQQKDFEPLFRFLFFATRSVKDYFNQVKRVLRQIFDPVVLFSLGLLIGMVLIIKLGLQLVRWILLDVLEWSIGHFIWKNDKTFHSLFIMMIFGFAIYAIVKVFYTLRVTRQTIVTGKESYDTFKEEFSYLKKDKEMLTCIDQNSLKAKG